MSPTPMPPDPPAAHVTVTSSECQRSFRDVADLAFRGERVVVTEHRKQRVAIVSIEDLELLERLEDEALGSLASKRLKASRKNSEPNISLDDLKAEFGLS